MGGEVPSLFAILPNVVRTHLLLVALLFSSLRLVAQNPESSPPSSDNPQAGQTQSAIPTASGTGVCGFRAKTPGSVSKGKVSQGKLIERVSPNYPAAARMAHVEGTVVLCATISKDGKLRNVRALSGPPVLIPAAMEAVEQWRYKPYRVNKEPIDVDSEIRVDFRLGR